ncbi:MAG: hypothetical protein AB7U73_09455 [Pirellulales bacterium]
MLELLVVLPLLMATGSEPYAAWVAEYPIEGALPASVGTKLSPNDLARLVDGKPVLPYRDLTVGIKLDDGTLWLGSKQGVMRLKPDDTRWRVFHSRLWLPSNEVTDLAVDAERRVWVSTPAGIGKIERKTITLEQKMQAIHDALRKYHVREGIVGGIDGPTPGKVTPEWTQPSSDNDGLWTALYVAAEAFRFGATGDETARENAWKSLKSLMFLEEVTGIPGFAARSFYPASVPFDPAQRHGGEWHRSKDGNYWWKGDTSSDELDGQYFAFAIYYDVAATAEQRDLIRPYVQRMTDHLLDHDYYYVGPSGKPTRWGVFAPEKLNQDLDWIDDRGLNSLEILSHLKVADHIVGGPRYAEAAKELIEKHSYAINTVEQKILWPPQAVNHSDDELAFLAYYPLLRYERDPELRRIYLTSLERSWQIERPEKSPFFNFIYAACRQAGSQSDPAQRPEKAYLDPTEYDQEAAIEWFREVPADTFEWAVKNSDRLDLGEVVQNRFDRKRSRFVLPIAERRVMRWNGDPYELDGGGDGRSRDDGTFILLPYWMGRYHRLID